VAILAILVVVSLVWVYRLFVILIVAVVKVTQELHNRLIFIFLKHLSLWEEGIRNEAGPDQTSPFSFRIISRDEV
jgi:hypothetical protein